MTGHRATAGVALAGSLRGRPGIGTRDDGTSMSKLSLLLVEDHATFRHALRAVIDAEDDLEISAETDRAELAGSLAVDCGAAVAIIDLDLPGSDGIAAIEAIRRDAPDTACLVLTALRDEAEFGRALEAGAAAILHKSTDMEELLTAIRQVGRGASLLSPLDTHAWLQAYRQQRDRRRLVALLADSLTPREKQVLAHLADGGTNASIAEELGISTETVQTHIRNLMGKLDVRSRLEAVTEAIRLGLVDPPS